MSRGRRYDNKPKLNMKKVIAVIVAFILIIMFVIAIKSLLSSDSSASKLVSTTYFVMNKDSKWGVIDNNGKTVIYPTYDDAIIIPNNKQPIFICTYDVNYEDGNYETKVLNAKGKEVFKEYDKVLPLENYDENNNVWYEANVLLVEKDGKYGLINFDGRQILDTVYEKIYTLKGVANSLITVKGEKLGLVDDSGREVIQNEYQEIKTLGLDTKKYIVKQNDKYGIYDVLDCKYQEILALNNNKVFCVKEDGKYKVINDKEEVVFSESYKEIKSIKDNIIVYKNSKGYTAYNVETKAKLEKEYKDLIYASNNKFIAKSGNNYGIINLDNEVKVDFKYSKINFYEDVKVYELEQNSTDVNKILNSELAEIAQGVLSETNAKKAYIKVWTEEGYKYFETNGQEKSSKDILTNNNLFLSKQNGKYGFVDKDGKVIVDYIYDDAREQNDYGYVAVKKDGLWGSLDKNGNTVADTKYNLEDNLVIDFIGEYHLGVDLNLKYYTK